MLLRAIPLLLALQFAGVSLIPAQTITGTVVEDRTRARIAAAEVTLTRPDHRGIATVRTVTDGLGSFVLLAPEGGRYRISVRHPAYVPWESGVLEVSASEPLDLEIRLGVDAIPVEPLIVTVRSQSHLADFERRRLAGGFGRFLTREEIEEQGASRTSQLLRPISGITLREVGRGRGTMIQMHSGAGLCEPAFYVDGVRSSQFSRSTVDDYLSPDMLDAVEVYTSSSGVPAVYAAEACGVISFWTRRGERGEGAPWSWKKALGGLGVSLLVVFSII